MQERTIKKIDKVRSLVDSGQTVGDALAKTKLSPTTWQKYNRAKKRRPAAKMLEFVVPPEPKAKMSFAFIQGTPDQVKEVLGSLWQ